MRRSLPVMVCLVVSTCYTVLGPKIALGEMPPAVQAQVRRVIVDVFATYENGTVVGSGIVCGQRHGRILILTAYHVVRNRRRIPSRIEVELSFMPSKRFEADLSPKVGIHLDAAVISIRLEERKALGPDTLPVLRIGRIDDLPKKREVFPCGNGGALESEPDLFTGFDGDRILFKTNTVASGFSGGGLFTEQGHLLGMILNHDPPIGYAVRIDNVRNWLTGHEIDVSQWGGTQKTPGQILLSAALAGNLKEVRRAFSLNASAMERDKTGMTSLHRVVLAGPEDEFGQVLGIIDLLLEKGAMVNAMDEDGSTPLHSAMVSDLAARKARTLMKKLISIPGIDVNFRNSAGETPLLALIRWADPEQEKDTTLAIFEELLRGGADVNAADGAGWTPLHYAAYAPAEDGKEIERLRKSIVYWLLRTPGVDPNRCGRRSTGTPLKQAISSQSIRTVRALLSDHRVDIGRQCVPGHHTPVGEARWMAALHGETAMDEDISPEKAKIILRMLQERDE